MNVLKTVLVILSGLASVLPTIAADLSIERRTYSARYYRERVYISPPPVWNPNRPADILYTGIAVYPGWHDNSAIINCPTRRIREVLPDGTIVIRRTYAC
jgi:hypothetical protein